VTTNEPQRPSFADEEARADAAVEARVHQESLDDATSLRHRVLNVRTIGSLLFGLLLLFLLFRVVIGEDFDWGEVASLIRGADPAFLLLSVLAYYATFPLRGLRWKYVLSKAGQEVKLKDATEILYLSWFVNCLVPAKLGDLYRAYLLRGNYDASLSKTVGTVFVERIADLIVIAVLALTAGFWSFRGRSRPEIDLIFVFGFIVAISLTIMLIVLRYGGHRLARFLPARIGDYWARFHEGSTGALSARSLPVILTITVFIWLLEGARLYFVIRALALPEVGLGISASVFVALSAALLTAIPLTPAGFGFVEAGIIGVLALYGVTEEPAAAVALVDRAVSIGTVIVLGGLLYAFSPKVRRAHGARPATVAET
jgi:glycosyltransferase 2 family protein